ncbi:MAG: patatin-like phospholipase family protein [Candidatus Krumholzibacteriia bacterium]
MTNKMLPVGLALSGGTARSVTHVGVVRALVEEGIPIAHVAGTSGGAVVGSFFASGMPLERMLEVANGMSWGKLISIRLSRLGFISSKRIEDFIKDVIGDITFEDFKIPCSVVATNLENGRKQVFNSGPVARVVRASCSIPQIFLPVEIAGHYYVDGGFAEYLPVGTLHDIDDMFVIAVHLAQERGIYRRPRNYLQLSIHIMGLVAKTNYVVSMEQADVLIHPYTDQYSPFDFDTSEQLIDLGYDTTKALIPEIKKKWKQKSSRLQRIIKKLAPGQS